MNDQFFFLLAGFGLSAIVFLKIGARRRPFQLFLLMAAFSVGASAQNWSSFLDSSRAINWNSAGFTIPNYTTNCSTQPKLTANSSSAASANTSAIQSALASCDATHNVVSIPAGTYYLAGLTFGRQGKQVVRGAGPTATTLILTTEAGCGGMNHGVCMQSGSPVYDGSSQVLSGGNQQCSWTGGLSQGSTSITLSNCGGAPPVNHMLILDQANDSSDTGGIYICNENTSNCNYDGTGSPNGRAISGLTHSQQQVTYVTGVTSNGSGSYTVNISPGVYFSNIRSSQAPGAWWSDIISNVGMENLTLDGTSAPDGNFAMYDCYQCWIKNVKSLNAGRNHVLIMQSANDVIRDSYFYQSQSHYSESYGMEIVESSAFLIENNIFQQVSTPLMYDQGSGSVVGYNLGIDDIYSGSPTFAAGAYSVHNAGNEMNLWEGNNFLGVWADDAWGSSTQTTYFRNMLNGWQTGKSDATLPIIMRSWNRAFNFVGNVLGQPNYHTQYQTYATSSSAGTGGTAENTSIYSLGWGNTGPTCAGTPTCDPKVFSTLMRWGNFDTATNGVKWDSTEASPAAVAYVSANFSSSYFGSLSHTLPASLYYNSTPSWWPTSKAWPATGPDVSTGNVGICSGGTYAGAQATAGSQCSGGSLASAWASHVTSNPAQDCYLNVMHGPPDGTGSALAFDASQCYSSSGASSGSGPGSPTGLTAVVK